MNDQEQINQGQTLADQQNPDQQQQEQNQDVDIPYQEGKGEPHNEEEVEVVEVVEELIEEDAPKKKKRRRWRRVKKKKRRNSFNLNGIIHLKPLGYDALKDNHLKGFFYSTRIRRHLETQNLITADGYIIENPQEYWAHKRIVREHYKSTSPGRRVKKYKKVKKRSKKKSKEQPIDKDNFEEFINSVKNQYGADDDPNTHNDAQVGDMDGDGDVDARDQALAHANQHAHDVDGDGDIDAKDVALAKANPLTDVNKDGKIDATDAQLQSNMNQLNKNADYGDDEFQ